MKDQTLMIHMLKGPHFILFSKNIHRKLLALSLHNKSDDSTEVYIENNSIPPLFPGTVTNRK